MISGRDDPVQMTRKGSNILIPAEMETSKPIVGFI